MIDFNLLNSLIMCPEQDSNLHASQHSHLKRARLPFRHLGILLVFYFYSDVSPDLSVEGRSFVFSLSCGFRIKRYTTLSTRLFVLRLCVCKFIKNFFNRKNLILTNNQPSFPDIYMSFSTYPAMGHMFPVFPKL